jgi:thiosulfate/3-mercaptopyruvate sulfurtransferase
MEAAKKWLQEDRPLTKDVQNYTRGNYKVEKEKEPDKNIRVYLDYVRNTLGTKALVDVRSPKEFTGEITAPSLTVML